MALFAIGDPHLSFGAQKPMDIFGPQWEGHAEKLRRNKTASRLINAATILGLLLAVGFAVYLDLTERLKKDDSADVDVLLIYSNSDDPLKVIKAVNSFTEKGESVAAYNYVPGKLTYLRKICLSEIE